MSALEKKHEELWRCLIECLDLGIADEQDRLASRLHEIFDAPEEDAVTLTSDLPDKDHAMDVLQIEVHWWAAKTFPGQTAMGIVEHLKSEVQELAEVVQRYQHTSPESLEIYSVVEIAKEAADCALLLMNLAGLSCFSLRRAMEKKLAINKLRKWGKMNSRGFVEHRKDEQKEG